MPDFRFPDIDTSMFLASGLRIVLIIVVSWVVYTLVRRASAKAIEAHMPRVRVENREQLEARAGTISGALNQTVKFVIIIVALLAILSEFSVNITPLLAALGIAGLALGFAAQGIVRDYIHGMFILMEDWYRAGEVASLTGDAGLVEELSLRRTVLRQADGTRVIIPNGTITKGSNLTRDFARISMDVGVAYGTDIQKAFAAINSVGQAMKADETWGTNLLTAPEALRINNLGDSAVEIRVMADTKPMQQWALAGEFRKRLLIQFEADGIEIPWPHMKVYFGDHGDAQAALGGP